MEKMEPQELGLGRWKAFWRKGDASRPGLCGVSEVVCSQLATVAGPAWARGAQRILSQARRSHSLGPHDQLGEGRLGLQCGTAAAGPQLPHPAPWRSQSGGPCRLCHPGGAWGLMSAPHTRVLKAAPTLARFGGQRLSSRGGGAAQGFT